MESGRVDIDGDDARSAFVFCECTCEETDGTYAKDHDGLWYLFGWSTGVDEATATRGVDEDAERFCECGELEGDVIGDGMEDICGVVKVSLEGAVDVGEAGGRGAEAHVLAEVVTRLAVRVGRGTEAEGTGTTEDACFDGDTLTDVECAPCRDGGHDTG